MILRLLPKCRDTCKMCYLGISSDGWLIGSKSLAVQRATYRLCILNWGAETRTLYDIVIMISISKEPEWNEIGWAHLIGGSGYRNIRGAYSWWPFSWLGDSGPNIVVNRSREGCQDKMRILRGTFKHGRHSLNAASDSTKRWKDRIVNNRIIWGSRKKQ